MPAWPQFAPEYHPQPARAGKCFHCLFAVDNLSPPVKVCRLCWPCRDRSMAWDGSSCACRGQPCCAATAPSRLRVASALACRHFALTAEVCSRGDGFLRQWHGRVQLFGQRRSWHEVLLPAPALADGSRFPAFKGVCAVAVLVYLWCFYLYYSTCCTLTESDLFSYNVYKLILKSDFEYFSC